MPCSFRPSAFMPEHLSSYLKPIIAYTKKGRIHIYASHSSSLPRRCIVSIATQDSHPEFPPVDRPRACTHSRIISDSVTEEEHDAGKVRCVECGAIVSDPYLKREGKET